MIPTEIAPIGNGVDSEWDSSLLDWVLVDFDSGRVVPGLKQFGDKVYDIYYIPLSNAYICDII